MISSKKQESFLKRFVSGNPNQRGQAFSVFELMIAAIVAIAILFVLLPIVTNITTPTGDAVTTLGNALSAVPAGSSTETAVFEVRPGQFVESDIFADKGIDPCSVYFDNYAFSRGDGTGAGLLQVETNMDDVDGCISRFRNSSTNPVRARATVVCSTNPDRLDDTLIFLELDDQIELDNFPVDIWGNENPGFSKVCIVILKRA